MDSRHQCGTAICAIFVLAISSASAPGQNPPADRVFAGTGEDSPPPSAVTMADLSPAAGPCEAGCCPSCAGPHWTAEADCIVLQRLGGVNQTLVTTYPVPAPPKSSQLIVGTGTERLNSSDLTQGFAGGPRVDLMRHDAGFCDVEFSFFEIDGWSNSASIAPNGTSPVFTAPGGFVQTTDNTTQNMAWAYTSKLYNAELNARWDLCSRVTMLAGFRWVNLGEDLQGAVTPSNRTAPFWDTTTRNNLYGFQIGEDWKMLDCGRFSLDGLVKAGLFDNDAEEATGVSIYRHVFSDSAWTNQAAFLGEIGLQCKYQVTTALTLKLGYQAIWLEGVALAPGQIADTVSHGTLPVNVQASGIACGSEAFFHGATAGLEYAF